MPRFNRRTLKVLLGTSILCVSGNVFPYDPCGNPGLEAALRCSDLIVLGKVFETLPEGVAPTGSGVIHTVHILKVEEYILGSGPQEIRLLTPGGVWTDSEGRKHLLSIGTVGCSEWRGARVGDEIVAFLKKDSAGYLFVNSRGSRMEIEKDPESGTRQVVILFHKKEYLKGSALQQYEEAKKRAHSPNPEIAAEAHRKLAGAFSERIPLSELSARIKSALSGEGGPKSDNTVCY